MMTDPKRRKVCSSEIYMDYNATTPLAPSVVDAITDVLTTGWQNPSSSYESGLQAKNVISKSRANIAKMLNGKESEIVFMSGGTEANNHILYSSVKYFKEFCKMNNLDEKKPHIISSSIEHDSILKVLKQMEDENIASVTYAEVSKELGHVSAEDVLQNIQDETVMITLMMANNETGALQPIRNICDQLKNIRLSRKEICLPDLFVHTDAAQAIGKVKVDVEELGVDYLTVVGHKFYGPRIGALWVRHGCPLYPFLHGGGQEKGKRPGTENTPMIAGLGEACDLVYECLMEYSSHMGKIRSYLKKKLQENFCEDVGFNEMPCTSLPNTLNISFVGEKITGRTVLQHCKYLQASVGAACHSHLGDQPSFILLAHGIEEAVARNAIRLSVGRETREDDVDIIVEDLKQAVAAAKSELMKDSQRSSTIQHK